MNVYDSILSFKYLAIFIGSFIEGPTVGLLTGFFARMGYIHLSFGYLAHVAGDMSADLMYYALGYFGGVTFLPKLARLLRYSLSDVESIEKSFNKHSKKLIILGKLTHVVGFPILLAAGMSKYPWYKFVALDLIATLLKAAILVFIGYHFGGYWEKVNNVLIIAGVTGAIVVGVQVGYFLVRRIISIRNGTIVLDEKEKKKLDRLKKKLRD